MIKRDIHFSVHFRKILLNIIIINEYTLMCTAVPALWIAIFNDKRDKRDKPHSCYLCRLAVGAFLKKKTKKQYFSLVMLSNIYNLTLGIIFSRTNDQNIANMFFFVYECFLQLRFLWIHNTAGDDEQEWCSASISLNCCCGLARSKMEPHTSELLSIRTSHHLPVDNMAALKD